LGYFLANPLSFIFKTFLTFNLLSFKLFLIFCQDKVGCINWVISMPILYLLSFLLFLIFCQDKVWWINWVISMPILYLLSFKLFLIFCQDKVWWINWVISMPILYLSTALLISATSTHPPCTSPFSYLPPASFCSLLFLFFIFCINFGFF